MSTAVIHELIINLLEKSQITSGNLVSYAKNHLNADNFVKVNDPIVEVNHNPDNDGWYGPVSLALISSISKGRRINEESILTLDVNKNGVLVSGRFSPNRDDEWHGIRRLSEKPIWVDDTGRVASLPAAWMSETGSDGRRLITDSYSVPLRQLVEIDQSQAIYRLCQLWVQESGLGKFIYQ